MGTVQNIVKKERAAGNDVRSCSSQFTNASVERDMVALVASGVDDFMQMTPHQQAGYDQHCIKY